MPESYTKRKIQKKKRYPEKGSAKKWDDGIVLYQCFDQTFGVSREEVDGGEFYHGLGTVVAAGFETESCTGTGDHHLTGEGRIIDCHIELKTLIMSLSRHTGPET